MGLPESRNTTYAPGSQLLSDDLNAIQDAIVNLNGTVVQSRSRSILPVAFSGSNAEWNSAGYLEFSAAGDVYIPFPAIQHERITVFSVSAFGTAGADTLLCDMTSRTSAGVQRSVGSISDDPPAVWTQLTDAIDPEFVTGTEGFVVHIQTFSAGMRIGRVSITGYIPLLTA